MNETVRVSHKLEREKTIQDHRVSYIVTSKKENITMSEHRRAIVKLNKNILKSAYRDSYNVGRVITVFPRKGTRGTHLKASL